LHGDEYQELIKKFSENWDYERLAMMDILIMQMAISEAIHFPSIPAKVTLNEYIEISKYYSTEKSSYFINGILDKVFQLLRTDEKIKKTGRGLIGEV
jgi:N utilization substance protein B